MMQAETATFGLPWDSDHSLGRLPSRQTSVKPPFDRSRHQNANEQPPDYCRDEVEPLWELHGPVGPRTPEPRMKPRPVAPNSLSCEFAVGGIVPADSLLVGEKAHEGRHGCGEHDNPQSSDEKPPYPARRTLSIPHARLKFRDLAYALRKPKAVWR